MKKLLFIACMLAICAATLMGCIPAAETQNGVNILKAGTTSAFDYGESLSALQKDWTLTAGEDGTISGTFSNSSNYLTINTETSGYATASQKVVLKPYSYYKVEYSFTSTTMTAKDESAGYVGLYVGFLEDKYFNNVKDGDNTRFDGPSTSGVETDYFYIATKNIREATLTVFVGSKDAQVKVSSLVLRDIKLTKVDKSEAVNLEGTGALYTLRRTTYGAPSKFNNIYVILGGAGSLLLAYMFYIFRARIAAEEGSSQSRFSALVSNKKNAGLLMVVGAGLIVRLAILLTESLIAGQSIMQTVYYGYNLETNAGFGNWLADYGMPYFYKYNADAAFMPISLYIATFAGLIGRVADAIGATDMVVTLTTAATIKAFAVAADMGVAVLIYKLVSAKQGKPAAVIMAGFYTLLPVAFSFSAAWGSMESITTFLVVLSFYCLLNKNYWGMAISYFAAALLTPSALLVCPFILSYTGLLIYKGIRAGKLWDWLKPVLAIVGGLVLFYLISLPFFVYDIGKGDAFIAFDKYIEAVKGLNVYSANAFNFQGLIGNNFKPVTNESTFVTILFVLFIVSLFVVAYFRSKSRLQLVVLAGGFAVVYWMFCNSLSSTTLLLALPLLFIYTAMVRDRRLYVASALYAASVFVNAAYVMMVGGYTSSGIGDIGYDNAMMYVFGSLNIVLIIYFVIVGYDAVINNKSSEFLVLRVPYGQYVGSVAKNIWIALYNASAKAGAFLKSVGDAVKEDIAERKLKQKEKADQKNPSGKDKD